MPAYEHGWQKIAKITCFSRLVFVVTIRVMMLSRLSQRRIRLVLQQLAAAVKLAEQIIKTGNDQNADDCADEHAAGAGGADGSVSDRACAGGHHQRKETGDERERGHLNRP